ncbi:hypothetical protein DY000_02042852 [Brassica cretica]|uniref:Uncharacterized protein n=1 Tax=Brassica cretica TaxID=69181 RepID=A0ABQ7BMY4_BRACR|nr:hypothetical protein DY000_02042852 [Brassica cretica]
MFSSAMSSSRSFLLRRRMMSSSPKLYLVGRDHPRPEDRITILGGMYEVKLGCKKLAPENFVCHWFRTAMWRRNYAEGLVPVREWLTALSYSRQLRQVYSTNLISKLKAAQGGSQAPPPAVSHISSPAASQTASPTTSQGGCHVILGYEDMC